MSKQAASGKMDTKKLAMLAILAAVAYVVMYLSKLIPVNVLGFLTFDLKDTVIVIAGFMFGPLAAAGISVVVSLIEMVTISSTGYWGLLMNVLSTCAFACTAAWIYRRDHTMKGAVLGLVIGGLLMTAVMLLWNYLVTPIYMGQPREFVASLLIPAFLPFNLIKAGINGTLAMLLYKPIVTALRKAKLIPPSSGAPAKNVLAISLVSLVVLATFILLALVLAKVI